MRVLQRLTTRFRRRLRSLSPAAIAGLVAMALGIGATPLAAQSRPFDHERHRSVACQSCHTTGTSVVRGDPGWCDSCHHQNRPESQCVRCHADNAGSSHEFVVLMNLPGGPEERPLDFPHEGHRARSCSDCHGAPAQPVADDFSCTSCHVEHHEAEAVTCSQCHGAPPRWAHTEALAHRTCAGGVCHQSFDAGPPEEWRPALCLFCHEDFRGREMPRLPGLPSDKAGPALSEWGRSLHVGKGPTAGRGGSTTGTYAPHLAPSAGRPLHQVVQRR